jgi:AGCS family alanine or glycine:cation symporter
MVIALVIVSILDFSQFPQSAFLTWNWFTSGFGFAGYGVKDFILSSTGQDCILPRQQMFFTTKQVSQSFSVLYIDTLLVCSAGGFMLLIAGKYNVRRIPC